MTPVAKMPNARLLHTDQCADAQVAGLVILILSVTNVGFL